MGSAAAAALAFPLLLLAAGTAAPAPGEVAEEVVAFSLEDVAGRRVARESIDSRYLLLVYQGIP